MVRPIIPESERIEAVSKFVEAYELSYEEPLHQLALEGERLFKELPPNDRSKQALDVFIAQAFLVSAGHPRHK